MRIFLIWILILFIFYSNTSMHRRPLGVSANASVMCISATVWRASAKHRSKAPRQRRRRHFELDERHRLAKAGVEAAAEDVHVRAHGVVFVDGQRLVKAFATVDSCSVGRFRAPAQCVVVVVVVVVVVRRS